MKEKERKATPVNVANDTEMVNLGLRLPKLKGRDMSLWSKTEKERTLWKKYRRFPAPSYGVKPVKCSSYKARLTLNIKGDKARTVNYMCCKEDINYFINKYKTPSTSVVRAFWNGKEVLL